MLSFVFYSMHGHSIYTIYIFIYIYRDEPYDILCECERYTRRQSHIQLAAIQCVDGFDIVVAKLTAYHTFIEMDIPKISIRSHFNAKGYEESWKVSPPRQFSFEQIIYKSLECASTGININSLRFDIN